MRRIWWLVLALSVGKAAAAQEIGPEDVIIPALQDEIANCMREPGRNGPSAALACFDRPGVTTDARKLSRAIVENTEFGLPGMLVGFSEAGQVDVAEIYFPNLANTNFQMALVNTTDDVQMAADLNFTRNPASVPSTRAILSQYPQAFESGRVSVVAVRHLPGGGQRFVLVDIVTNGCRACAPVATSLRYFDFFDGSLSGFMEVGWQRWQDLSMARAADKIRNGDVATIQDRLNHMGYEAGPTDGAAGPRTMAALMSFKQDYCLLEDKRITDSLIAYLTPEGGSFPIPPCAPGAATRPVQSLPFPDGVYAADADLCPTVPLSGRVEPGDRAFGLIINVADGNWTWGESVCTIRQAIETGSDLTLYLDCLAEGMSHQSQVRLAATYQEGFSYLGRTYYLCNATSAQEALGGSPIFPISGAWISANYGAHGTGPASDPNAYFSGQYHAATDIAAVSSTPVLAPVAGDIVYFRERVGSSGSQDPVQTFAILRDKEGRDWIFAHMDCTICPDGAPIGDLDTYPEHRVVHNIAAGTQIGVLLDYPPFGSARGDHLHLGLINRPITENGRLLPAFHRSGWALVLYSEGEAGAVDRAAATATGLGFIDPMDVLPEP